MKSRILALLLVLAIAPGLTELVELVVHYATYGDIADSADDPHESEPLGVAEHGCSGTFHIGACHGGQTAALSTTNIAATSVRVMSRTSSSMPLLLHDRSASAPELRPPIA